MEQQEEQIKSPAQEAIHSPQTKKRKWVKWVLGIFLILGLIGGAIGGYFYLKIFGEHVSVKEDQIIRFSTGISLEEIAQQLADEKIILDKSGFLWTADLMKFKGKAGQFLLTTDIKNNKTLIQKLRGNQHPVKLTFNNCRTVQQWAGQATANLEIDSMSVVRLLEDFAYINKMGYDDATILTLFIPNTYEILWTYSSKQLLERMQKEHEAFWQSKNRLEKAKALELSPEEVYTLASIVEMETKHNPEKPRVAGVYLNRLRTKGWKLEADPTVVFATGDFGLRRVLKEHLEIDSPYNTYKYPGLPPGPIYMPSISSIDAVLDAEEHDYMFFCAEPGYGGKHAFSESLSGHLANARRYHRWLNKEGIR